MDENTPSWEQQAFDKGYKEALLDVYCFLTANVQILDYPDRLALVEGMIAQVNTKNNKLTEVA